MIKHAFLKFGAWVSVLPVLFLPSIASAQTEFKGYKGLGSGGSTDALKAVGAVPGAGGGTGSDLPTLIGRLISGFLGILGIILVGLVIYAGILYMTAAGDNDKVKKAKTLLTQAVIGIIIIVAAYSISAFVIGQITTVATGVAG